MSQYICAAGSMVLFMFLGISRSAASELLPQLRDESSPLYVTPEEEHRLKLIRVITPIISWTVVGIIADKFGRKKGLIFYYLAETLGFATYAYSQHINYLYLGNAIRGISKGFQVCAMAYIVEVSTGKHRNEIYNLVGILHSIGVALANILGGYLSWQTAFLIYSIISIFFFILEFSIPESPQWLFQKGQESACIQSFGRLGRTPEQICLELRALKLATKDRMWKVKLRTFVKPTVWKPFVIVTTLFILQSATGIFPLLSFTQDVVEEFHTTYDSRDVTAAISVFGIFFTATIALYISWTMGRRATLALSSFGMTVSFIMVVVYQFMFRDTDPVDRPCHWFPLVGLALIMSNSDFGVLCLPWLIAGELFPLKIRGRMIGISLSIGYILVNLSTKIYKEYLGHEIQYLSSISAVFCLICGLFSVFVLPETQNKSLVEIEENFLPEKYKLLGRKPDDSKQSLGIQYAIN